MFIKIYLSIMADKLVVRTPKQLYRFLLRQVAQLPEDTRDHYKHKIRQVKRKFCSCKIRKLVIFSLFPAGVCELCRRD